MSDQWFSIPAGMDKEDAAKAMNAYLLGAISGRCLEQGPYVRENTHNNHWQLDGSNDFWLFLRLVRIRSNATLTVARWRASCAGATRSGILQRPA